MITFGLTALLLAAETYVMMRNVKMFIRGETEVFSLVLALVLALIMTALPHAVGAAVITSRRRGVAAGQGEAGRSSCSLPSWLFVGRADRDPAYRGRRAPRRAELRPLIWTSRRTRSTSPPCSPPRIHLAFWTSIAWASVSPCSRSSA